MKKHVTIILTLALIGLIQPSCQRSGGQVWEDTKTCGRYMGKGFKSFFGKHSDSGEIAFEDDSFHTNYPQHQDVDFISLKDAQSYQDISMNDYSSSGYRDSYPQSKFGPGDPESGIPGINGFKEPSGHLTSVFVPIYFATDSYSVQGADNLQVIQTMANYLKQHPHTYIFVEGHADERGAAAYNLSLGAKRSNSVRSYLIQDGVNLDQIFTISYGKERPYSTGHDETAWQLNRRSQFKIYER